VPARTTTSESSEAPPAEDGGELLHQDDYRKTPDVIERELEHMNRAYEELPKLERLPDFLSVNDVVALFPEAAGRDGLRQQIHDQLSGGGTTVLSGLYLDEEERLLVLWITDGALTQVLSTFYGEKLLGRVTLERARPRLGDVLGESDGARPELLVEHITSMSVCCLPESLSVYRVGKRGALSKVLTFAKSHREVGPGVRWGFMNHFEFSEGRVEIQRIHPDGGPRYEFLFDGRLGRYQPTAGTVKVMAAERAAPLENSP
jgi:hypothetical protein